MGGLKFKLAATMAFLVLIAAMLGNWLTLLFIQRSLVGSELAVINRLVDNYVVESVSQDFSSKQNNAENFCRRLGQHCVLAGIYGQGDLVARLPGKIKQQAIQFIERGNENGDRKFEFYGSVFKALMTGERYLFLSERIDLDNGGGSTFFLIWDLSQIYSSIKSDQRIVFVYLLVNVLILSVIGFFRLVNLVIKPIDRLIETADQYQLTNNVFYSESKEHSEFSQLNTALNNMLKRIEEDRAALHSNIKALELSNMEIEAAHREIVQAEKLASIGRLSAGFAHEIGNPIAIIQGYVELLKSSDIDDERKQEYGAKALEELERINRLIRQLLDYARESGEESKRVIVDEHLVEGVLDIVHLEKERAHIRVSSDFEPGLTCTGSSEAIRQVLLNCLLNAIDAIGEHNHADHEGLLEIQGYRKEKEGTEKMIIEISDNGSGISEDQMSHAFEPFYSTKPVGKGTGLGLYVSHLIVESLGGRMWLRTNDLEGATVSIELPLCMEEIDAG